MINITLHLLAGSIFKFECPTHGPLYEQVAGIAMNLNAAPADSVTLVDLPLLRGNKITIALSDILAVETQPAHTFPESSKPVLSAAQTPQKPAAFEIPKESPAGPKVKLTIGMATFDDYDGVYFTIQALRLYHPEVMADVEFVVIDNNPTGPCAAPLKNLETQMPNYRYVPYSAKSSTTARELVFSQSNGEYVMCMDCHVLVVPGALKKLINYFDADPDTIDLLQGPLLYDNLDAIATHFKPEWQGGMYGSWDRDKAGSEIDAAPFDIPMQGLGLFACRRAAWQGFSDKFSGFGGEEGYIHEKFRQAGGRTLCLPFLRWVHRFNRPLGVPYHNSWEDRIRNYVIGFLELGLDITPIGEHFTELLGKENADRIIGAVLVELEQGV